MAWRKQSRSSKAGKHLHHNSVTAHRAIRRPSSYRAFLWRWRWVIVALLIGVIIESGLASLRAANPATSQVLVAASDLATGTTLSASNVQLAALPKSLLPKGTLTSAVEAEGQVLVAPLPKGAPIYSQQLFTSAFASSPPPGTVIDAIQIDDEATLAVLQPGDRLALYSPPDESDGKQEAHLLTDSAVVMTVRGSEQSSGILGNSSQKAAVFVAIPKSAANLVIGLGAKGPLHAVIRAH